MERNPKVAMKGGRFILPMRNPLTPPTAPPASKPARRATSGGKPPLWTHLAMTTADRVITEPADRSTPPEMITMQAPIDAIATKAQESKSRPNCGDIKKDSRALERDAISQATSIATRTMAVPNSRVFQNRRPIRARYGTEVRSFLRRRNAGLCTIRVPHKELRLHLLAACADVIFAMPQESKAEPFAKEIEAFEAKDKASPPPQGEIVFVGSSSIRLWKSTEAFPDLKIINRGFGGSQMADALRYADRIILPYRPRIVVVFAGGNDINAKKTPDQVFADFKALVGKIQGALPKTRIYFISLFPNVARKSQDAQCQKANELIEAYMKTDERLGYIDTASRM